MVKCNYPKDNLAPWDSYFLQKRDDFMHIAICDDNIADRKQMERLLSRESDKRLSSTGNLYIDSYGNAKALLEATLTYDAYYIDMCRTEGITGMDMVMALTEKGILSPMILCCSDINYRELTLPENILSQGNISYLDKPLKVPELSESIDRALEIKKQAPVLIELRDEKQTYYISEEDFFYAVEDEFHVWVTLTDGRKIQIADSALNLFAQIEGHPVFVAPSDKTIINCRHISKLKFRKAIMSDGTGFKIHKDCMPYVKEMYTQLHNESHPQ